jgi:hypothetical protein
VHRRHDNPCSSDPAYSHRFDGREALAGSFGPVSHWSKQAPVSVPSRESMQGRALLAVTAGRLGQEGAEVLHGADAGRETATRAPLMDEQLGGSYSPAT